jgi:hypothetical protein
VLGKFNIGLSCAADGGLTAVTYHKESAQGITARFVVNPPQPPALTAEPYGGPCFAP